LLGNGRKLFFASGLNPKSLSNGQSDKKPALLIQA